MAKQAAQQLRVMYEGRIIDYQLTRKRVKNLNLRVRADGTVAVSAPYPVELARIEAFVLTYGARILAAKERYEAAEQPWKRRCEDGEEFLLFGEKTRLCVKKGTADEASLVGQSLVLTMKEPGNLTQREKLTERFLRRWFLEECEEVVRALYPKFAGYGVPAPEIRVREMKSRWGSCIPGKKTVTFNLRLMAYPRRCLEYVAVHELCHLLEPNHSRRFYGWVERMMPDWRERKEALKQR